MAISEFPNQLTRNWQKLWSKTMVFSSQLRQFPQMIIALVKYAGYMFTSSPNCMMSSSVAMDILCITNIGSISSKRCWKIALKMSDCVISFIENLQKYLKCTGKHSVKVQISIDTENKIMQSRELDGKWCHEHDPTAVYFGCKNKLNKQIEEHGVCMFCEVS